MKRVVFTDEFYLNQPEKKFQEDLRKFEPAKVFFRADPPVSARAKGFVRAEELFLVRGDFAEEESLETAWEDLKNFLEANGLSGEKLPVALKRAESFEEEEFLIETTREGVSILSGGAEGIRRALVRLQDEICVGGGFLPQTRLHAKPRIKHRITRCFFSPTNRPPKNGDELADEIDYYPEAYLNRLAHDGVNGIWIYSSFDLLLKSSYITEYGGGGEKRLEKLNRVIAKCARYGIRVYLFAMEPMSLTEPCIAEKYPGIAQKYPQSHGNKLYDFISFCTYTDFAKGYCTEAVERLFAAAPGLGGMISITQGERITSCTNMWPDGEGVWRNNCPHCSSKSRAEILAHTLALMSGAIRKAKPSAEYVSWTYAHRLWQEEEILEYVRRAPAEAVLMQNFEDNGRIRQLGKKRIALDYWLSYTGPSRLYELTAREAVACGKRMFAKMQICCSHECASVPYIPVPGLIFDKVTRAARLGTEGIMESWYFGNYPCLMSKAVDLLGFGKRFETKRVFLAYLAGLYWRGEDVEKVVRAWEYFEAGYIQMPVNVMFSYYGPMHDGIVWELSLLPKNFSLSRSWQLIDRTDGDRIGECLFHGHTLDEAVQLLDGLNENWQKGCALLLQTRAAREDGFCEQISVARALQILFRSGRNVMRFYQLRGALGRCVPRPGSEAEARKNAEEILREMKEIVREEIGNCKEMIPLCEADNRLGYHSEAEGFKFHPAKLRKKISQLELMLSTEFPEAEERIGQGLAPLRYYLGEEEGVKRYQTCDSGLANARWEPLLHSTGRFRVNVGAKKIEMEFEAEGRVPFIVANEFEPMFPQAQAILKPDGSVALHRDCLTHQSYFDEGIAEELKKWRVTCLSDETHTHLILTLSKKAVGFAGLPYKAMISCGDGGAWCVEDNPVRTLGKSLLSPGSFGWLV